MCSCCFSPAPDLYIIETEANSPIQATTEHRKQVRKERKALLNRLIPKRKKEIEITSREPLTSTERRGRTELSGRVVPPESKSFGNGKLSSFFQYFSRHSSSKLPEPNDGHLTLNVRNDSISAEKGTYATNLENYSLYPSDKHEGGTDLGFSYDESEFLEQRAEKTLSTHSQKQLLMPSPNAQIDHKRAEKIFSQDNMLASFAKSTAATKGGDSLAETEKNDNDLNFL